MSILDELQEHVRLARDKHPEAYHSYHEGYSFIKEEFDELWDSIRLDWRKPEMRKEAFHIAVTALRFIEDLL